MKMVEVTKPFINRDVKFLAGRKYVMAEDTENQMRTVYGDALGMSYPIDSIYRKYEGQDLNGKKLITFRTGGIGDIFWLSAVIQYLKKKYPSSTLRVASSCKQSLENIPGVEVYDMPFDSKLLEESDYGMYFQGIIEGGSEQSKKTHAVDMFFNYFGLDSTHFPREEKKAKLYFTKAEMDWMGKAFKGMGIKDDNYLIGIQMETSAPLRNFPKEKLKAVIDVLAKEEGVKIFLIGTEQMRMVAQYYKGNYPNVFIATDYTVRQTMVMTNRYNMVIAPDSFMVQVAGSLDKPLVGLYGPFPSEVRMKYFKNAVGLDSSVVCSPCYKHDFRECIKGFPSPCFSQIKVEDVLQAVDYLKYKFTGSHFNYMGAFLATPDLQEVEKYMLSADKGLCFFSGYYNHPNIKRVDPNPFVKADIKDLSTEFKRGSFPFVLFMNDFSKKGKPVYEGSKGLIRPGGHFIVYRSNANEQIYTEIKKDVGGSFTILYSKFDPIKREFLIVGKKNF